MRRRLLNQLRSRFPALKFELTGETPINFDLRKVSSDDVRIAESRVLPVVLVLLLATFASLVAALLAAGSRLLAMLMTLGAAAFLSRWWHLSILIQNIATMLGSRTRNRLCTADGKPVSRSLGGRAKPLRSPRRIAARFMPAAHCWSPLRRSPLDLPHLLIIPSATCAPSA